MNSPLHGVLVSVRNLDEACRAQAAGVDLIDLKEPADGALGGLPCALIREVVTGLRGRGHHGPLSATIGDVPMTKLDTILARVQAVAATGVDIVKVGITSGPEAAAVIDALAPLPCAIIPVFLADDGLDPLLLDRAHPRTLSRPDAGHGPLRTGAACSMCWRRPSCGTSSQPVIAMVRARAWPGRCASGTLQIWPRCLQTMSASAAPCASETGRRACRPISPGR